MGNTLNLNGGAGNNERYEGGLFATRLNANQTIGVNSKINNTVNGVANSGTGNNGGSTTAGSGGGGNGGRGGAGGGGNGGGNAGGGNAGGGNNGGNSSSGSGGTTNNGNNALSYRDQLGKKVRINTNYSYNFNNNNLTNSSVSQIFSSNGTTFSTNNGSSNSNTKTHNFSFELEADLDSNNFLRVVPTITYSSTGSGSQSAIMQTGLIHQDQTGKNTSTNTRPVIGATVFYQHIFQKPRRNLSVQLSLNDSKQEFIKKEIRISSTIWIIAIPLLKIH